MLKVTEIMQEGRKHGLEKGHEFIPLHKESLNFDKTSKCTGFYVWCQISSGFKLELQLKSRL